MSARHTTIRFTVVFGVALLLIAGVAASRSIPDRATSLGTQLRGSSLVAVGVLEDGPALPDATARTLRLRIESVVKSEESRTDAVIRLEKGVPLPPLDRRVLIFLVPLSESEEGSFRLALGPPSVVALPAVGASSPALDLVRAQAEFLADDDPTEVERTAYRSLLVRAAVGDDALTGRSALLDLASSPLPDLGDSEAADLLRRFGTLPAHDSRRLWLVRVLGRARAKSAARPFANALAAVDGRALRGEIADALRAIDAAGAAERVLALRADGDARIRADAISVLGRWGRPAFRPSIEGALEDRNAGVREESLVALGRIGHEESIVPLRKALRRAKTFRERRAALWALGRIGGPVALTLVRSVARDESADARLRRVAERVLREPGSAYFLD